MKFHTESKTAEVQKKQSESDLINLVGWLRVIEFGKHSTFPKAGKQKEAAKLLEPTRK